MRVFRTLALAGVTAVASAAIAAPVPISQWNYAVTSTFVNPATFTVGSNPIAPNVDTPTFLAWGNRTPGNQSELEILGNPAINCAYNTVAGAPGCPLPSPPFPGPGAPVPPGPIHTTLTGDPLPAYLDGEIGLTQTFVHRNRIIPSGSNTLDEVDVLTTLLLQPIVPPNISTPVLQLTINVNFQETPNAGPCVDGDPPLCPDIFVIGGGLNNFNFWYNGTTGAFSPVDPGNADFSRYFVQIFPFQGTPLNFLSPAACAAAGAAFPCQGFKTEELTDNFVQFGFAITTDPIGRVPEPGTLALFALALVGLGVTARRRQA